jgi:hypothetical protein
MRPYDSKLGISKQIFVLGAAEQLLPARNGSLRSEWILNFIKLLLRFLLKGVFIINIWFRITTMINGQLKATIINANGRESLNWRHYIGILFKL